MASTNKLYPPIINGVLPAFYKRTRTENDTATWYIRITVPFSMSQMVSKAEIKSMFLRLKTVQSNEVKYCGATDNFNIDEGVAIFDLTLKESNELIEGLFYKAQLAYCSMPVEWDNGTKTDPEVTNAGYFSTVGITKCISKPLLSIANFDAKKVNLASKRYLGTYEQDTEKGDSTEKVYSYSFIITDENGNEYVNSGVQLHNVNNDINSWSSEDEFIVNKVLPIGTLYYIQYNVTTINGLNLSSPTYRIMAGESVDMEKKIILEPELNYDEGYIQINMKGPRKYRIDNNNNELLITPEDYCSGLFLLSRGHLQDDYMVWEDISRFNLNHELPSTHIERDFTIEQGVTYKYRLYQYNRHGVYSNPVESEEIYADFEDMFLYDGVRQLKVRFNPKVSSFKVNIPEQKLETIGSKYPFIFRNGNVYYHEFPISGLISYQLDEAKLFLKDDEILDGNLLEKSLFYKYPYLTSKGTIDYYTDENGNEVPESIIKLYNSKQEVGSSFNYDLNSPRKTYGELKYETNNVRMDRDLTSENLMSERYFKLAVLAWLTNGEIKLFRSPGEGNYLVRLLNTSLTPNDTLGRMLHTFNTTAYEIADLTYDNLLEYKLITVEEPATTLTQFSTFEFQPNLEPGKTTLIYSNPNNQNTIYGFEINDCMPGDQIKVTYSDDNSYELITIGVTGSYHFTSNGRPIARIDYITGPNNSFPYPRSITVEYVGEQQHYFDLITKVTSATVVGRTYFGPQTDLVNAVIGDANNFHKFNIQIGRIATAYKTKLLNMEMLRVRAREIIPLYRWRENGTWVYNTTPFGVGYPLEELKLLTTSAVNDNAKMISNFAIFKVYNYTNNAKPPAVEHLINVNNNDASDLKYYEMYPNWKFAFYWDPQQPSSSWTYSKAPVLQFAINTDINSNELNYIDLTERHEMTLYNLGPIQQLWLGNGVMAETVMRIEAIDYSLEDTNQDVYNAKQEFLAAKNAIVDNYQTYITTNEAKIDAYNNYLSLLAKYEQAQEEIKTLQKSYNVLVSMTANSTVLRNEMTAAITTAVTGINSYINTYYTFLESYIPNRAPAGLTLPTKPTTLTVSTFTNQIANATDNNLISVINNIIISLQAKIAAVSEVYTGVLANYMANIPDTSSLRDLLPSGWTDSYWQSHSVAQIVTELTTILLQKLQNMYTLLHKRNITTSPFTSNYFSNKHIPTAAEWSIANGTTVLNDQENVAGIVEITYEDIFPEEITDETILYNSNSQILQYKQAYDEAAAYITIAEQETVTAYGNYMNALEAYNNYEAINIKPKEDIIADCEADKNEQQATIDSARALIAGLELEEDSDGKDETINFLQALIHAAEAAIIADDNTIAFNQTEIDTLKTSTEYINAKNLKESTYATWRAKQQAEQDAKDAAVLAHDQIINAINTWDLDLTTVKTYIAILQQVNALHNIPLSELQEQIDNYRNWHTTLVNTHTEEKNKASNSVQDIISLQIAFNKLDSLKAEWEARLADLRAITRPANPGPPDTFDWNTYITRIKNAWGNFINLLQQAYQAREEVYYQ